MFLPPFSSAQTNAAKILWLFVVLFGFIGAGILIGKSYKEWQENPIANSISTHPIDDLDFPIVTVCPPKDSSTAIYHDLIKAGHGNLSEESTQTLKREVYEIFIKQDHKNYLKQMLPFANTGNLVQMFEGFHSLPKPYNFAKGLQMNLWSLNGTITTPWFGEQYGKEYFKEDKDFYTVLALPDDIKEHIGSGILVIELEVDTRHELGWIEDIFLYTLHTERKEWSEAEAECQREGGHLASATSQEVENMLMRVESGGDSESYDNAYSNSITYGHRFVWLGGRKELGKWTWSDNSTWDFSNWDSGQGENVDENCVVSNGKWQDDPCTSGWPFICQTKKTVRLTYTKDQLNIPSFHVWYRYKAASQQLLDSWEDKRMTGFQFGWKIEEPRERWTLSSNEVGRSIQTSEIGECESSSKIYSVALTIPDAFEENIDNETTLLIELETEMKQEDELTYWTDYRLYNEQKTWIEADKHCRSEGGKLATIHSKEEQAAAQKAAMGTTAWIGGRVVGNDWIWSDNSTHDFTNWNSDLGAFKGGNYLLVGYDGKWSW